MKHVLTYMSCVKKRNSNGLLGLALWNHIIHNPLNMNFISLLNTIEECLMAPCLAFAQFLNWKDIVNMEYMWKHCKCHKNVNLLQNVLLMLHDDYFIFIFKIGS